MQTGGHYRTIWPAQALIAQGAGVELVFENDDPAKQVQSTYWAGDDGTRTLLKVVVPDCDVIVLQRPLTDTLAQGIPKMQAAGIKVVVEIDDDFEHISPRNVSWQNVRPPTKDDPPAVRIQRERRNYVNLRRSCELADLVVVSTPALAGVYGRHGRVVVVPNCVPELYLWTFPEPREDGVRIGWSGSTDTHPDDLQVTKGAVQRAMRATGAGFHVIGGGRGVRAALNLAESPSAAGWQPIDRYPVAMAGIDVGIVPLEMSRFNEAKSALKMMEFAALGVPVVASPTGENMRMFLDGIGLLAERPKDWEVLLKRLCVNEGERMELAGAGREAMQRHTIEGRCDRWYDAWSSVVNTRAATSVA